MLQLLTNLNIIQNRQEIINGLLQTDVSDQFTILLDTVKKAMNNIHNDDDFIVVYKDKHNYIQIKPYDYQNITFLSGLTSRNSQNYIALDANYIENIVLPGVKVPLISIWILYDLELKKQIPIRNIIDFVLSNKKYFFINPDYGNNNFSFFGIDIDPELSSIRSTITEFKSDSDRLSKIEKDNMVI